MNSLTKLIITSIITAIIAIYGIELSIRTLAGSRGPEYLIVVVIILVVLLSVDWLLYLGYKKRKAS